VTETVISSAKPPNLPLGWTADNLTGRGVDLRLSPTSRRLFIVAGAATLAVFAGWRAFVHWDSPGALTPWLVLSVLLILLALWCAVGDELWHIEINCLVHRVGVGRWAYSRRYQDAELEIVLNFSTNFNVPYYRLYAVVSGKQNFLIERSERDLQLLANFISFHTGWRIRSQIA
jgi:hypothetical protein